jgi:hypothetical protein
MLFRRKSRDGTNSIRQSKVKSQRASTQERMFIVIVFQMSLGDDSMLAMTPSIDYYGTFRFLEFILVTP